MHIERRYLFSLPTYPARFINLKISFEVAPKIHNPFHNGEYVTGQARAANEVEAGTKEASP
jgi:hypothetical protein